MIRGLPDIEILTPQVRLKNVNDIFDVCDLPMLYDGDTGGKPEHLSFDVRALERTGVSMIVIEDKKGLKRNSLLGNDVFQEQEAVELFCEKIGAAKGAATTRDFMVTARCESLILDAGMADALARCSAYVDAGADAVMIHSRKNDGREILEFASHFRSTFPRVPLVCVPTSYHHLRFAQLQEAGFNVIIYANHMLRSAYQAMKNVSNEILREGRTQEVEPLCLSINEILALIPEQPSGCSHASKVRSA
jgi:phosphoenolpyruvate phosphomutase